jgi:hypothetical protein
MRLKVQNFVTAAVMGMIETPNLISAGAGVHWNALVNRLSP